MAEFVDGAGGFFLRPMNESCKSVVIAIDFGTSSSGIAFAFKNNPTCIRYPTAAAVDAAQTKVPTALLECPDGSWMFGHGAETKYYELLQEISPGEQPAGHLYKRFKMVLKGQENGFDTLTARSLTGKSQSLMLLITKTLTFLKEYAITQIEQGYFGREVVPENDVQWVLTVPAIWSDFGKAFMRKAAFKAGLIPEEQSDNLILVLEPEGAALAVHVGASQNSLLSVGSRFMALDCGGGTVDITVHEVLTVQPFTMKAIAPPTGGDWGGDYVNMEFKKFLAEFLGPDMFKEHEWPLDYCNIYEQFNMIKVSFDPDQDPENMRIIDVMESKKQLLELVSEYNAKHPDRTILIKPALRCGFIQMSRELMLSFFEPFLRATVDETRRVLATTPSIRHIMVVGGFGSSKVLTARIRAEFHNRGGVTVIVPENPKPLGAIVHGAVYFGLHKNIMQSRVAAHTYGIAMHSNGVENTFHVLVTKGQILSADHEASIMGVAVSEDCRPHCWRLYRSDELYPATVTGEHFICSITAECPPDPFRANRWLKGVFNFGGSEMRVTIENAKGDILPSEIRRR